MNADGTLKKTPGPQKSKDDLKAQNKASKAKLQAKKDALRLAFVTHRDALANDDKWTGPRKYQDWLEEQGWAALKASPPAAAPASAASSASLQPSAAEKDDANRKRNINRINCKCPPFRTVSRPLLYPRGAHSYSCRRALQLPPETQRAQGYLLVQCGLAGWG